MKLYGYSDENIPSDVVPVSLAEVTLCATPIELRRMAEFLSSCATEMESMGSIYDHVHLSDRLKEFKQSPHFVVARVQE